MNISIADPVRRLREIKDRTEERCKKAGHPKPCNPCLDDVRDLDELADFLGELMQGELFDD